MDEAKELFDLIITNQELDEAQTKKIYDLDSELYDYDNHKRNELMQKIIDTRVIKSDVANICHCSEDEIALSENEINNDKKYLYTGLHIYDFQTKDVINGTMHDMLRYTNYGKENKSEKHISDKLKDKCLNGKVVKYNPFAKNFDSEYIKKTISTSITCFCAGAALVASLGGINSWIKEKPVDEFINKYHKIVADATRRTDDGEGYYYLSGNIAKDILKSDDEPEAVLYAVYDKIDSAATHGFSKDQEQVDRNMNLLMSDLSLYSDNFNFSSFEDYLKSRGFTNEKGEADIKLYNDIMRSYIEKMLIEKEYNFSDSNGGMSRL